MIGLGSNKNGPNLSKSVTTFCSHFPQWPRWICSFWDGQGLLRHLWNLWHWQWIWRQEPKQGCGEGKYIKFGKILLYWLFKHDYVKAPKPTVPLTTEKSTLNKKVQKIFTTQSIAKPTLSYFQFKVLLVVTLTTLVLLLLLGGACITLLLKPEKGCGKEKLVPN